MRIQNTTLSELRIYLLINKRGEESPHSASITSIWKVTGKFCLGQNIPTKSRKSKVIKNKLEILSPDRNRTHLSMASRAALSEMQLDRYQMTGSHQRQDTVIILLQRRERTLILATWFLSRDLETQEKKVTCLWMPAKVPSTGDLQTENITTVNLKNQFGMVRKRSEHLHCFNVWDRRQNNILKWPMATLAGENGNCNPILYLQVNGTGQCIEESHYLPVLGKNESGAHN